MILAGCDLLEVIMPIKSDEIPFVMGQKVTATLRGEVFSVCIRGWMKGQYVITQLCSGSGDFTSGH